MNKQASGSPGDSPTDAGCQEVGDFLYFIEPRHDTCQLELQALAQHLYPHTGDRDALLTEASRLAFVTLSGYLFENYQEEQRLGFPCSYYPTIGAVDRLASFAGEDFETSHRVLLWNLMQRRFLTEWTRAGFDRLLHLPERQLQLVMEILSSGLHGIAQPEPDRIH